MIGSPSSGDENDIEDEYENNIDFTGFLKKVLSKPFVQQCDKNRIIKRMNVLIRTKTNLKTMMISCHQQAARATMSVQRMKTNKLISLFASGRKNNIVRRSLLKSKDQS